MLLPLLFATFTMSPNPALTALRVLLANNSAQHSIKTGALTPASAFTGFHNHLAYYVTALYRLGASADELSAAYAHASVGMLPPAPRRGLVNASTWEERVGSCGCGLVSGRTDLDYLDYYLRGVVVLGGRGRAHGAERGSLHPQRVHFHFGGEVECDVAETERRLAFVDCVELQPRVALQAISCASETS